MYQISTPIDKSLWLHFWLRKPLFSSCKLYYIFSHTSFSTLINFWLRKPLFSSCKLYYIFSHTSFSTLIKIIANSLSCLFHRFHRLYKITPSLRYIVIINFHQMENWLSASLNKCISILGSNETQLFLHHYAKIHFTFITFIS